MISEKPPLMSGETPLMSSPSAGSGQAADNLSPVETPTPAPDYCPSLEGAEWWVILARGAVGFRYGPYTGAEAGQILARCNVEGIPAAISANCGREFDWDVARDFARGNPANWQPMAEAPHVRPIVADAGGQEVFAVWWGEWDCWRALTPQGAPAAPIVTPLRWRELTAEELAGLDELTPAEAD